MPNWCDCTLTIKGPNRQAVLDKLKGNKAYLEDGKDYVVYFDLENIIPVPEGLREGSGGWEWAYNNWGCLCAHDHGQEHQALDDADVISFETPWGPPSLAIRALSAMFPANTFILDDEVEDPSSGLTLFRGGKHSRYWTIPNYNSSTGKTATLYEICIAVLRRTRSVQEALAEVQRIKTERLTPVADTPNSTTHDPTYDSALDAEAKAMLAPRLYAVTMIPADEEQIADLLIDGAQVAKMIAERPAKADVESPVFEVETVL